MLLCFTNETGRNCDGSRRNNDGTMAEQRRNIRDECSTAHCQKVVDRWTEQPGRNKKIIKRPRVFLFFGGIIFGAYIRCVFQQPSAHAICLCLSVSVCVCLCLSVSSQTRIWISSNPSRECPAMPLFFTLSF